MTIPGYDDWKLMTPDEDREARGGGNICPFCGAYSSRSCELSDEMGGACPWEESEPDPDEQRDLQNEDKETRDVR